MKLFDFMLRILGSFASLLKIIFILIVPNICFTQNFLELHKTYLEERRYDSLEINLLAWGKSVARDETFYIEHLNFYFLKSKNSIYYTNQAKQEILEDSLGITDFMVYMDSLEIVFFKEAIHKVDEGLLFYSNRLDLIFGKLYVIRFHQEWDLLSKEIIKVIELSRQNNNQWLWEDNKPISEEEFLCTIEEHINFLATHQDDSLQFTVIEIAKSFLDYYPERYKAKFDLAIAYLLTGNLERGIELLHELEETFPNNLDIIYNLARAYQDSNENQKAIEYFIQMKGLDDESAKKYAKKQIRILKKGLK